MRCRSAAVLTAVLAATPAAAQEPGSGPGSVEHGVARLEVGGQIGVIGVYPGALVIIVGGPRLTVNLTPNDAVEGVAEVAGPLPDSGIHGLYGVQYKRRFGGHAAAGRGWFATAGVLGAFRHYRQPEWRELRPDGSTLVRPGFTSFTVGLPAVGIAGVGIERDVKRHLRVRAELQAFAGSGGVGVRASGGLSIPLGGTGHRVAP